MKNYIKIILDRIEDKNNKHALKLKENLKGLGDDYFKLGNTFFEKYEKYLSTKNLTLDYGIDFYLKMIEDMIEERIKFIKSGKYSNSSFKEVEKNIYSKHEVMTYHMHGLVLAQFLWFDQYQRIKFFGDNILKYCQKKKKYLEIGGGHGLYMFEAMNKLPDNMQFDLVDISQSSLNIAKGILSTDKINFHLKNFFDFSNEDTYDFITIGEVLEHVEEPEKLLRKISKHLGEKGVCYITTPINAPMIDHIYLFNNEDEIRSLLHKVGLEILEEKIVISEKISPEKASKFKIPIIFAAFVKNI